MAKIEDVEGLENIDKIIELVDGIMIGRGDFGIEIGVENMPMVQKEIIKNAIWRARLLLRRHICWNQ